MKKEMNFKEALIANLQGEKVEFRDVNDTWVDFPGCYRGLNLGEIIDLEFKGGGFRLKPRTITVNGREVQAGETVAPELQSEYFLPHVSKANRYAAEIWDSSEFDLRVLDEGLVHLTKEAAIAHAKAMLNID